MNKLKSLLAVALVTSAIGHAQRSPQSGHRAAYLKELSIEQVATLKTKKMTLALDLSAKQQTQVMDFNLEEAAFRKARMNKLHEKKEAGELKRPSAEERFAMENAKLDRMIAQQDALKKILSDEQFQQWKKIQFRKHDNAKKKMRRTYRKG